MKSKIVFVAVFLAFFSFACSLHRTQRPFVPNYPGEASFLLKKIQTNNKGLVNFKCSGSIEIKNDSDYINARTVMCVAPPLSFRLEALSPAGQPAFRMAGNPAFIYVQPESDSQIYKKEAEGATLEKLAGIEIRVHDLLNMLCGKPPAMPEGAVADLDYGKAGENLKNIIVFDSSGTLAHKIKVDSENCIKKVEVYDHYGKMVYSAQFEGIRKKDGFIFPLKIFVETGRKSLRMNIRQIWPNTEVSDGLFVLTPSSGVKE